MPDSPSHGPAAPAPPPRRRNVLLPHGLAAQDDTPRRPVSRMWLACVRMVLVLGWTLVACAVQALLLPLRGRARVVFARRYWSGVRVLLGVSVRCLGAAPPRAGGGRPVVFVSNHSSWLDIAVLGGLLEACFVSKADVAGWPVVGTVARLGRTVFVSRRRSGTGRERDDMRARLAGGDNLLLFPEGTSSDGSRVLAFHTSFFAMAEPRDGAVTPLIVPVSLAYDRLGGLPAGRTSRPMFAWYGDMALPPHLWRLAQCRGMRATVVVHPPIDPAGFASRKALALAAWTAVADGAAAVRQNRAA